MDQSYLFQIDEQVNHRRSPSSKAKSHHHKLESLNVSFTDSSDSSMLSESESNISSYLASFSKIQGKQITQRLLNRLLDLRNVTFFRQHFSVALVPYIRDVSPPDDGQLKSPRMEVAENCLLNIEQVVFKTFNNHYNSVCSYID